MMQITSEEQRALGDIEWVKRPACDGPPAQRDPAVIDRVSDMLNSIERGGIDAVRRFARELDGWEGPFEIPAAELEASGADLDDDVRASIELGFERTQRFAAAQRQSMRDFEIEMAPGVVAGYRYLPVERVGAYLPAGRFPLLASPFMTVGVAKAAGVPMVLACTPPAPGRGPHPAVLYSAFVSGADRAYALGGVQALAAMAFGLLGEAPVDMLVGAGNAFVAEAKRQLSGGVGIDLLAGPSEVAVIADATADPALVAADLLGQAEHGPNSPVALITTCRDFAEAVVAQVDAQLSDLATQAVAGPAWRDFGSALVVQDFEQAAAVSDTLAPEHLEIQTADDDFFLQRLRNYGSLFLGEWSTVAFSDKGMAGTNHVLPTGKTARYTAGLSVARFLRPLTYQRASREGLAQLAPAVECISNFEGLAGHRATATRRIDAVGRSSGLFDGTPAVRYVEK